MPGHDVLTLTKPAETFVFADIGRTTGTRRSIAAFQRRSSSSPTFRPRICDSLPGTIAISSIAGKPCRTLATRLVGRGNCAPGGVSAEDSRPRPQRHAGLIEALGTMLADGAMEPAFLALMLTLPGEPDIAREIGHDVDPDAIFEARSALKRLVGNKLAAPLFDYYRRLSEPVPYQPDPVSVGRRALRNSCLDLLIASGSSDAVAVALRQCQTADNMTDRIGALSALALRDVPERGAALDDFYERYQGEPLIIDKWFSLQATIAEPATLDRVKKLTAHPAFSFANPNRVRALIHAFALGNQKEFNRADGAGYGFVDRFRAGARSKKSASRGAAPVRLQELARARTGTAGTCASGAAACGRGACTVSRRRRYRPARAGRRVTLLSRFLLLSPFCATTMKARTQSLRGSRLRYAAYTTNALPNR